MRNIALTGGGTGGHIFPLLGVYNYLKEDKNLRFIWFGEEGGLEEKVARENGIEFVHIPSGKIRRYFDVRNFYEPLKNVSGVVWGIYYIIAKKIDTIFSKGGYVSLPLCIAGFLLRKKIYIHESDYVGGIVNNLIGKMADKVFYAFPSDKIDNKKHILVGQILNPELIKSVNLSQELEENEKLEVLVIAGSQGSKTIFESLKPILGSLSDVNFSIILGEKNLSFRKDFENLDNVRLYDFVSQKELASIYKETDIAITRAGATTLWELYFFGIHSIIIPLSSSAQDHQLQNARYFKKNFGSDLIEEGNELSLEIFKLLSKYKGLRKKGLNLKGALDSLEKVKAYLLQKD